MSNDQIEIRRLAVPTNIGVPNQERATPQTVWISLWLTPSKTFDQLNDSISQTIDYAQVACEVGRVANATPRHLIETLATDLAKHLLANYPILSLTVKIEKKILPDTEFVAVKITRP